MNISGHLPYGRTSRVCTYDWEMCSPYRAMAQMPRNICVKLPGAAILQSPNRPHERSSGWESVE